MLHSVYERQSCARDAIRDLKGQSRLRSPGNTHLFCPLQSSCHRAWNDPLGYVFYTFDRENDPELHVVELQ